MRSLLIIYFTAAVSLLSHAQFQNAELKQPMLTPVYAETKNDCRVLYLPAAYGKYSLDVPEEIENLFKAEIIAIDLVYTDYPAGNMFEELNRKRFSELARVLEGIKIDEGIPVNLVRQTKSLSRQEAERDFHGFVIYYKERSDAIANEKPVITEDTAVTEAAAEITRPDTGISKLSPEYVSEDNFFKKMIDWDFNADTIAAIKEAWLKRNDSATYNYFTCYIKGSETYYKTTATQQVKVYTKEEMLEKGYISKSDEPLYKGCRKFFYVTTKMPAYNPMSVFFTGDSAVEKTLNRNRWDNMLVCADVTGSMSPYMIELLVWLKLNAGNKSLKYFIAFNDGDNKEDKKKKIGQTGGIYGIQSNEYKEVAKTVYTGIMNGSGGDAPENDIEALLEGENRCPECRNIVLIADNNAPVKDIKLVDKLTKPVKIILCGAGFYINTDYLNIARRTGGSVHTIENDITNLALLKEGEIFEFKGHQYKLKGGSFVDVTVVKTKL